ncbi:hypothetical protein SteCoe_32659 [Stentor coeruleus]|uniref:dual-specificity kinase n=1 Tax=Stentor coeruleus TaxID=5963 RepID=A0A1R2AYW8_9CILI|nr:hypothetical protein SteCoe_32659 [Stentor coeruleus]
MRSEHLNFSQRKTSSTGSSSHGSCSPRYKSQYSPRATSNPRSHPDTTEGSYKTCESILQESFNDLSIYEHDEIILYDKIYYIGQNCVKASGAFTDDEGDYMGLVGDHLAYRYEIIKLIGKGAFGQVYECLDHKYQENVAIKILKNKNRFTQSGLSEIKLLTDLDDTDSTGSIVKKYANFEFRGHLCIVFELLSISLYEFLEKHNFSGMNKNIVKRIAVQLLITLKLIHSLGVIHCDLKPENILFKYEGKSSIKLIDFGSACFQYEKLRDYVQSRYYRAPEIVLGGVYNEKIDLWSLGCILVECTIGIPLFPAESEADLLKKQIEVLGQPPNDMIKNSRLGSEYFNEEYQFVGKNDQNMTFEDNKSLEEILDGCDTKFIKFIKECLEWDPEMRFSAEDGLNHPWIRGRD